MNYVFIIEAYNDLDMIAPIIWKSSTYKNSNVVIVNASPKIISYSHPLIRYIRKNKSVEYYEIPKTLNDISKYIFNKLKVGWLHSKYLNPILKHPQRYLEKIPINRNYPTAVFVSYFDNHNIVKSTFLWAKKHNCIKIFINHGITPFIVDDKFKEKVPSFDLFILNNKFTEKSFHFSDNIKTKKLFSCPRFSKEWSDKLSEIYSTKSNVSNIKKFRITFMLSKFKKRDDKDLVIAAIKAASEVEDTEIIIKPHTRGMGFTYSPTYNVFLADENSHSRNLIEQSDVIIFTRSSIFLDAVLLNKPVIHLSYATKVDLSSKALNSCKAQSLQDFISKIRKIKSSGQIYLPEDRKECLNFYAGADDGKMLDNLLNQIKNTLNNKT